MSITHMAGDNRLAVALTHSGNAELARLALGAVQIFAAGNAGHAAIHAE
jgi:hypothetical protein